MQRVAFQLRIRAGQETEYDRRHEAVWPELLEELRGFGVREYSIFRRGQELVLTLRVPEFAELQRRLAASEVNARWQAYMAEVFEPVASLTEGEGLAMMEEVFYMQGWESAAAVGREGLRGMDDSAGQGRDRGER